MRKYRLDLTLPQLEALYAGWDSRTCALMGGNQEEGARVLQLIGDLIPTARELEPSE